MKLCKLLFVSVLFFVSLCSAMELKTAFFDAIKNGNIESVMAQIEQDRFLLESQQNGITVLICAIENKQYDMVRVLVQKGADVNAIDRRGETPLAIAISQKNYHLVKLLLDKGARIISDIGINHLERVVCEKDHMLVRLIVKQIDHILKTTDDPVIVEQLRNRIVEAFECIKHPPLWLFARGTIVSSNPRTQFNVVIKDMRIFEELRVLIPHEKKLNLNIKGTLEALKLKTGKGVRFVIQVAILRGRFK